MAMNSISSFMADSLCAGGVKISMSVCIYYTNNSIFVK